MTDVSILEQRTSYWGVYYERRRHIYCYAVCEGFMSINKHTLAACHSQPLPRLSKRAVFGSWQKSMDTMRIVVICVTRTLPHITTT
jgi:hypothetical protein